MKLAWTDSKGEFKCKTCIALAAYIFAKTGVKVEVHKTKRYIVFNYVKNGQLRTTKVILPAGVLYCLNEEDLKPLFDVLKKTATLPRVVVFGPDGKAVIAGTPASWTYEGQDGFTQKVMQLPYSHPDFIDYDVRGKTRAEIVAEIAALEAK